MSHGNARVACWSSDAVRTAGNKPTSRLRWDIAHGQRVVYGLLGISVLMGLLDRTRLFSGTAIAMLGIRDWMFVAPVFIGDTLTFRLEIQGVRTTRTGDRGIVERHFELLNQRDEVVQRGNIDVMVRSRSYREA